MLVIIATGTRAQDPGSLPSTNSLPLQVCKGMDMSYDVFRFKAFNCHKQEDILTQSIPHGCSVKVLDGEPQDTDSVPKQKNKILQKVQRLTIQPHFAQYADPATIMTVYGNCM